MHGPMNVKFSEFCSFVLQDFVRNAETCRSLIFVELFCIKCIVWLIYWLSQNIQAPTPLSPPKWAVTDSSCTKFRRSVLISGSPFLKYLRTPAVLTVVFLTPCNQATTLYFKTCHVYLHTRYTSSDIGYSPYHSTMFSLRYWKGVVK
jgi:hypothetical protein